jgi:hypothetical protein
MATLYDIQPELEPIEWTHYDCWFIDESQITTKKLNQVANEILNNWEKTLGITFVRDGMDFSSWTAVYDLFDDIVDQVIKAGYSVYKGSDFIEIYRKVLYEKV